MNRKDSYLILVLAAVIGSAFANSNWGANNTWYISDIYELAFLTFAICMCLYGAITLTTHHGLRKSYGIVGTLIILIYILIQGYDYNTNTLLIDGSAGLRAKAIYFLFALAFPVIGLLPTVLKYMDNPRAVILEYGYAYIVFGTIWFFEASVPKLHPEAKTVLMWAVLISVLMLIWVYTQIIEMLVYKKEFE